MCTVSVTIDIDENVKNSSEKLFRELGFSLSSVINAFLRQTVREQKISFGLEKHEQEQELSGWALTEKTLQEIEQGINMRGPFQTVEEMMEHINSSED